MLRQDHCHGGDRLGLLPGAETEACSSASVDHRQSKWSLEGYFEISISSNGGDKACGFHLCADCSIAVLIELVTLCTFCWTSLVFDGIREV